MAKSSNVPAKQPEQAQAMDNAVMKPSEFTSFMRDRKDQIVALLGKSIPYERFEMVALMAIQKNRDLLMCIPQSLFYAFREAAKMGLEPDGKHGVITFYDTQNGRVAKFNPMYQGMLIKVLNDPAIKSISTAVVGVNDEFEYEEGSTPFVKLKRNLKDGSGDLVAAYSLITLTNGAQILEILTRPQAMDIRNAKKGRDKGVWDGPFAGEMWRKAVLRRGLKWAPISTETKEAIGDGDEDVVDAGYTEVQHPDNYAQIGEPPNPHQIEQQKGKAAKPKAAAQQPADAGDVIEGTVTDPSLTAKPGIDNPDAVLKDFEAELSIADSAEEIEVTIEAWRERIETMLPPDMEAANKMIDRRRSQLRG